LARVPSRPIGGVFDEALKAPTARESRDCLLVLNDGGMLPGLEGWREAKLGTLVRHGETTSARYTGVWGDQDEFQAAMRAALDAERWQSWKTIVWLADGARSNWVLAETVCPTALQILDVIHAVENGVDCGKALLGENDALLVDWQRRITTLVHGGAVDTLVSELMDCAVEATDAGLDAIDRLIGYYRHNQSRMDYPRYRAMGLPIGSGIVESAHRHVLQTRMKMAGQHWSRHHGRRMVALRTAYRTAGPERFHAAINRAFALTHRRAAIAQAA
jgi:hypothetical protein